MQMHTERGIISVVCEFPTDNEAREGGVHLFLYFKRVRRRCLWKDT